MPSTTVAWLGEKLAACEQQAAALTALLGFCHLLWLVATKTDVHKRLTPASHHLVRNGRALWGGVSRQRCEGLHLATYFMWESPGLNAGLTRISVIQDFMSQL